MSTVRWIIDDGVIRARLDDPTTNLAGPELARARTTLAQPHVTLLLESRSPSGHTVAVVRLADVVLGVSSQVPTPGGPGSALRRANPVLEVSIAPLTRCLDEILRLIPPPGGGRGGAAGSVALSLRSADGASLVGLWLIQDGHYLCLRPGLDATPRAMTRAQVRQVLLTELASTLVPGLGELDPDDEWAGLPGAVSA